jgi:cytochrome bd-type quinol oxidase subunit 2
MEKIMWLVLGGVALVAALRAGTSSRARSVARTALGVLFIVFGGVVNAVYLATDNNYYARFADDSPFAFVRDTWRWLVVPNQLFFISLLIVFEVAAGVLIMSGGRRAQAALVALIGFHVGQLVFGWFLWLWAVPMLVTFVLLLRAERRAQVDRAEPGLPRSPRRDRVRA